MTDDEIAGTLASLAVAGHETTLNSAGTLVYLLAADDTLQAGLRAAPERAGDYVEEMLRLRSPAQNFARRTTREVDVGGTVIPAGAAVLLSYAAANRDPRQFPRPDEFDVGRAGRRHLAFGWGIHLCIGAALARAELRMLLECLAIDPPFRLDGEVEYGTLQGGNHPRPATPAAAVRRLTGPRRGQAAVRCPAPASGRLLLADLRAASASISHATRRLSTVSAGWTRPVPASTTQSAYQCKQQPSRPGRQGEVGVQRLIVSYRRGATAASWPRPATAA